MDDEALIRWSLSEALSEAGYTTRLAASGSEARLVLRSLGREPLVIVLDMRLPDVNDLSLARDVRRMRSDAPLILMSAHVTPEDVGDANRLGIFRVVNKPFDVPGMVALVGQAWTGAPNSKE